MMNKIIQTIMLKRWLFIALFSVVLAASVIKLMAPITSNRPKILPLSRVELADTPLERVTGLNNHSSLCKDCGMLFIHPHEERLSYTTRNMAFPIDIIFLNEDGRVINIYLMAPPKAQRLFESEEPAKYVLELKSGMATNFGIAVGDVIDMKTLLSKSSF